MKCEHEIIPPKSFMDGVRTSIKERNEFAKDRQEWIQASFDLYFKNDHTKFHELSKDLCESCITHYKHEC